MQSEKPTKSKKPLPGEVIPHQGSVGHVWVDGECVCGEVKSDD